MGRTVPKEWVVVYVSAVHRLRVATTSTWASAAAPFLLLAILLAGCPANTCFIEICDGKDCHCPIDSCTDGAEFNTTIHRCQCNAGRFPVAGQCLTQPQANQYCGVGFTWVVGPAGAGCMRLTCPLGQTLDDRSGACMTNAQVAAEAGVGVGQGQKLGCPPGEVLVVNAGQPACIHPSQVCAKDEMWNGSGCQKINPCPTGETFDPALARCVPYASSGGASVTVNVQQWAYSTYGPPNGPGTPSFCGSFARKPLSFGIAPGVQANVRVQVNLTFPGSDVARGTAQTTTVFESTNGPVPTTGAAEVQNSATAFLAPLVGGGGRAMTETASTTVRCLIANGSKPVLVPDEQGGF